MYYSRIVAFGSGYTLGEVTRFFEKQKLRYKISLSIPNLQMKKKIIFTRTKVFKAPFILTMPFLFVKLFIGGKQFQLVLAKIMIKVVGDTNI